MVQTSGELDLDTYVDKKQAPEGKITLTQPAIEPYNIDRARETVRLWIALVLLLVLCIIVLAAMTAALVAMWQHAKTSPNKDDAEAAFAHVKDLTQMVFGPIVALVSAATGFYFGAAGGMAHPPRDQQKP
jgi:hypothetical protein